MAVVKAALFIDVEGVQVGGIISVGFCAEWTVLDSECGGGCAIVIDLALDEELLDWDLGFVEFGLVDEKAEFGEVEGVWCFGLER